MEEIKPNEEISNEEESFSVKKRILRKRLGPRKKAVNEFVRPEKKVELNEINQVLSNLYDGESPEDMKEFEIKKSGSFFKTSMLMGLGIFFAAVLWAGFFIMPSSSRDENQVSLGINGPTELFLSGVSTYSITYANNSDAELKNVVLNAYYPEGFIFESATPSPKNTGHNEWKLGNLAPYEKGSISVSGYTYGSLNEKKSWRVFLNYTPNNFNSELQKATTLTTAITFSPIKLSIAGPEQISAGVETKYTFELEKGKDWKKPLQIVPEIPANFSITSSSPTLDKKNSWQVSESSKDEKLKFTITGKFSTGDTASSTIKGSVIYPMNSNQNYQIANAEITSDLVQNDVVLNLTINGSVNDFDSRPGDTLNATLRIKNSSATEIRNVTAKLVFSAPSIGKQSLLKWAGIVDKFDGDLLGEQIDSGTRLGTISWNKSHFPSLDRIKPNDEVSIDIQLPIKNAKEFDLSQIKNSLITVNAETKYSDAAKNNQTITVKPININLNSDLSFENDYDKNSGGKYTVNWTIKNTFHPLKNIKISATTFGNLEFNPISKGAGDLSYDAQKNNLTWSIAEMPLETDVLNASFSLSLGKVNPSQSLLLSKVLLTAEDTVTGKTITLGGEEISLNN